MTYHAIIERTYKDRLEFIRTFHKVRYNVIHIIKLIFEILLPLIILRYAVPIALYNLWNAKTTVWIVVLAVIELFIVFQDNISALIMAKREIKSGGGVSYEFTADEIVATAKNMTESYKYTAFTKIYRRKAAFYLFVDKNHAFLLPERCLTDCDGDTFAQFISRKCGLEIINLK